MNTIITAVVLCTFANWEVSSYCTAPPDLTTLTFTEQGMSGELTSGAHFEQTEIFPGLEKFTLEGVYWYINKDGMFYAENDLQALSIIVTQ